MSARGFVLAAIILGSFASRLVPGAWNFRPCTAAALLGAAYFPQRRWAVLLPMFGYLASDVAIGLIGMHGTSIFYGPLQAIVYGSMAAITLFGLALRNRKPWHRVGAITLSSSAFFFLTTNFGVWLLDGPPSGRTFSGLLACYAAGIPFFGAALLGDLSYAIVFFGAFAWAEQQFPALRSSPRAVAEIVSADNR